MLGWIEAHAALAAWLQAIGGVSAIGAAFLIGYLPIASDRRERARERRLQIEGLALLLVNEFVEFTGRLNRLVADNDLLAAQRIEAPPLLQSRLSELHLMGPTGAALLRILSILNVTRRTARRVAYEGSGADAVSGKAWEDVAGNLETALADAEQAITGMREIITGMREIINDGVARRN
jgi:hypothetical protein